MKKILMINGSPNKNGNTKAALSEVEAVLKDNGLETFWFELGNRPVRGCLGCDSCEKTNRCVFNDDPANELIEKMLEADAVIVGTPVYFAGPNGALCALLDRTFYAASNYGQLFKGKPAAAVATCWRAGATPSLDRLNKYFTFSQMPVVSSCYWCGYLGEQDEWGINTLRTLGKNMAEMLK